MCGLCWKQAEQYNIDQIDIQTPCILFAGIYWEKRTLIYLVNAINSAVSQWNSRYRLSILIIRTNNEHHYKKP